MRNWRWAPWWGVGAFAIVTSAAFLFNPVLRTFTHEFAFITTSMTCIVTYSGGILFGRRKRPVAYDGATLVLMQTLLIAFLFGVVVTAVHIAANQFIFECDWRNGAWFFVSTWFPAALFAASAGTALGLLCPTWKRITVITIVALLVLTAHDVLQLYFGPRIHPVDPLLGDLAGFSQRETLAPSAIHLRNRVFLLLLTLLVWDYCRWRLARVDSAPDDAGLRAKVSGIRAGTVGAVLMAAVIGWGGWFGIGFTRQPLEAYYDQVIAEDGLRIYYPRDPRVLTKLDIIAREAAWHRHVLTGLWETPPDAPVDLYLFPDLETLHAHTGIAAAHAGLGEVFLDVASALSPALRHELVHALHPALDPSPVILFSRAMLEGTAVAFEDLYAVAPDAHEVQAAALAAGELPSVAALFTSQGFRATGEFSAYEAAGSFFGFLVLEYGMETYKTWQQSLDFEDAYGRSLDTLEAEWRVFLSALDVRSETRMTAAVYFNPTLNPGYLSVQCPKVGEYPEPLLAAAEEAWHREHYRTAADLYRQLYARDGEAHQLRMVALALEKAELRPAAAELLEVELAAGDWRPFERAALMAEYIVMAAKVRDWERLYDAYAARAELDFGIAFANRMGERALRDPAVRDDYAVVLEAEETWKHAQVWQRLLETHAGYPPLLYLYAEIGRSTQAPLEDRAQSLTSFLNLAPDLADDAAPEVLASITELIRGADYALAEALANTLIAHVTHPVSRYAAEQLLARIAFEN